MRKRHYISIIPTEKKKYRFRKTEKRNSIYISHRTQGRKAEYIPQDLRFLPTAEKGHHLTKDYPRCILQADTCDI